MYSLITNPIDFQLELNIYNLFFSYFLTEILLGQPICHGVCTHSHYTKMALDLL